MTQQRAVRRMALIGLLAALWLPAQEIDYSVYTDRPRLLLNQRRLRLLQRERERESMRWMQFDSLMSGKARMDEPGFASALYGIVTNSQAHCRQAADWAEKTANPAQPGDLRQMAIVYDWCAPLLSESQAGLIARRISPTLKTPATTAAAVRSQVFAALALADTEPEATQAVLKGAVEGWWVKQIEPQLKQGNQPFANRTDLYAMVEFHHVIRDNLRADLRESTPKWWDRLPPLLLLSYYPAPWPAAENEFRIPAYTAPGDPDLKQAAMARATELALVALDTNSQPHQFLQGWLMIDRFLMRGSFGIPYEFLWANPYLPGLSFTYMPDLFHHDGVLLVRSSWEEDATWLAYRDRQAQMFKDSQRIAVKPEARPSPVTLGQVRIHFASSGLKFDTGWAPPVEEGGRAVEEVAFVVGLEPNTAYDVEVDNQEMFEVHTDRGGILELQFAPGTKAGVRLRKASPTIR